MDLYIDAHHHQQLCWHLTTILVTKHHMLVEDAKDVIAALGPHKVSELLRTRGFLWKSDVVKAYIESQKQRCRVDGSSVKATLEQWKKMVNTPVFPTPTEMAQEPVHVTSQRQLVEMFGSHVDPQKLAAQALSDQLAKETDAKMHDPHYDTDKAFFGTVAGILAPKQGWQEMVKPGKKGVLDAIEKASDLIFKATEHNEVAYIIKDVSQAPDGSMHADLGLLVPDSCLPCGKVQVCPLPPPTGNIEYVELVKKQPLRDKFNFPVLPASEFIGYKGEAFCQVPLSIPNKVYVPTVTPAKFITLLEGKEVEKWLNDVARCIRNSVGGYFNVDYKPTSTGWKARIRRSEHSKVHGDQIWLKAVTLSRNAGSNWVKAKIYRTDGSEDNLHLPHAPGISVSSTVERIVAAEKPDEVEAKGTALFTQMEAELFNLDPHFIKYWEMERTPEGVVKEMHMQVWVKIHVGKQPCPVVIRWYDDKSVKVNVTVHGAINAQTLSHPSHGVIPVLALTNTIKHLLNKGLNNPASIPETVPDEPKPVKHIQLAAVAAKLQQYFDTTTDMDGHYPILGTDEIYDQYAKAPKVLVYEKSSEHVDQQIGAIMKMSDDRWKFVHAKHYGTWTRDTLDSLCQQIISAFPHKP